MEFQSRFFRKPPKGLEFDPAKDLAKQEFKEETDINGIVSAYMKTGSVPGSRPFTARYPQFGDFSGCRDLGEVLMMVQEGKEAFMSLPVNVRERFHNNIAELDAFVRDEKNRPEAEKLGLVEPRPRPESDQPLVITQPMQPVEPVQNQPEAALQSVPVTE